jgi:hypothetical protein
MNNIHTLELVRDVIDNEHGGVVYDETSGKHITPRWNEIELLIQWAEANIGKPQSGKES